MSKRPVVSVWEFPFSLTKVNLAFTDNPHAVCPVLIGRLFLQSARTLCGRRVVHFEADAEPRSVAFLAASLVDHLSSSLIAR